MSQQTEIQQTVRGQNVAVAIRDLCGEHQGRLSRSSYHRNRISRGRDSRDDRSLSGELPLEWLLA
jgi:hypothetical protein